MVTIHCAECSERLGRVGPSLRAGNPQPVWHIEPGWVFSETGPLRGILQYIDETYHAERRLYHELTRGLRPEGLHTARECNLPLCVRCPRCHKLRWVAPTVVFAGSPG